MTGKLLSKICKNENNNYIALYQICLPKLRENILQYYRLNLFKEIIIGFNHDVQVFPMVLFKLLNAAVILAFSSPLIAWSFVILSLDRVPYIIMQVMAVWDVR